MTTTRVVLSLLRRTPADGIPTGRLILWRSWVSGSCVWLTQMIVPRRWPSSLSSKSSKRSSHWGLDQEYSR